MGRYIEVLDRKLKHAATCGRRFTAGAARGGVSFVVATRFWNGAGKMGRNPTCFGKNRRTLRAVSVSIALGRVSHFARFGRSALAGRSAPW